MSSLLARIMLAVFMLPLAALVYTVVLFMVSVELGWTDDFRANMFAGVASWLFIAVYWHLLWRSAVRWNQRRVLGTVLAVAAAIAASAALAWLMFRIIDDGDFASLFGTASAPLFWVVG